MFCTPDSCLIVLNYHYNCLQAIALKEPMPEAFDETVCRPLSVTDNIHH